MPTPPITSSAIGLDLSPRYVRSAVVAASPALAAETIIATLTVTQDLAVNLGVRVTGWAAFTVGTSGTAATLRLRHTDVSGAVLASTGATSQTAANLASLSAHGLDTVPVLPGQVYVLTLQVANGAAASTVSAVYLDALVI